MNQPESHAPKKSGISLLRLAIPLLILIALVVPVLPDIGDDLPNKDRDSIGKYIVLKVLTLTEGAKANAPAVKGESSNGKGLGGNLSQPPEAKMGSAPSKRPEDDVEDF